MSGGVLNAVRLGGSPTLQSLTASFSYFSSHNCDYYYVFLTEFHGYNPSSFIALPLLPTAIFSSWVWDPVVAMNKKWNTCVCGVPINKSTAYHKSFLWKHTINLSELNNFTIFGTISLQVNKGLLS